MATTQVHHEVRFDITSRISALLSERAVASTYATRYAAIGVPSATGDGGVACTNQLGSVVSALTEVLSNTVGDADFGNIPPVICPLTSTTVSTPRNIGTDPNLGLLLTLRIANLLPFPSIKLRPFPTGVDVDMLPFIVSTVWTKETSPFPGAVGVVSVGNVTVDNVTVPLTGAYKVVVKNPLDTRTEEVVSTDVIYLTAP